jgi:SnoaL-like domain
MSSNIVIHNPVVEQYFRSLNAEDFQATASLFAKDGTLYPPFQEAIEGQEAIAQYLSEEAKGIKLFPIHYSSKSLTETGNFEHTITGKIQTALFVVNALWQIELNIDAEIYSARVKLMASLAELLSIRG